MIKLNKSTSNYIYVATPMSSNNAENYCLTTYNTHLATIKTRIENIAAYNLCNNAGSTDCWIGLNRIGTGKTNDNFKWLSNEIISYTNWESINNEPTNANGNEYCTYIKESNGKWNDVTCDNLSPFLCDINTPKYYYVSLLKTQIEANNYCINTFQTRLATILSSEDNNLALNYCNQGTVSCWIGLYRINNGSNNSSFQWLNNNQSLLNSFWSSNEPGIYESCVEMYSTGSDSSHKGSWNDADCNLNRHFLCDVPNTPKYYYVGTQMNFSNADNYCFNTYGSHLANIISENENNAANYFCSNYGSDPGSSSETDYCWIGLQRISNGSSYNDFKWLSNDVIYSSYNKWKNNEPNNDNNNEYCIEIRIDDSEWNDCICSDKKSFLCNGNPELTNIPSLSPIYLPSKLPTLNPTNIPSYNPSLYPTNIPSLYPSNIPTYNPSYLPSNSPTLNPTITNCTNKLNKFNSIYVYLFNLTSLYINLYLDFSNIN